LDGYDLVAVVLDGKTFAEDELVIALGVTVQGQKVILGFVQTATENARVIATLLRELLDRGLRMAQGLLASALLDIEPRLRRVRGYRALPKLRDALQRMLRKEVTAA